MPNGRNLLLGAVAATFTAVSAFNVSAQGAMGDAYNYTSSYNTTRVIPHAGEYKHQYLATESTAPVGMAIVFAIDISGSISSPSGEYHSQIEALAEAIASDDFRQSIFMPGGPGSIAISVVDYDDKSKLLIPWVDLRQDDPTKFIQLGIEIQSLERRSNGGTEHSAALENAAINFEQLPWESDRNAVNIMTDGTSSTYNITKWREALAEEYNATIYALVTEGNYSASLNPWAEDYLITPSNTYTGSNGRPLPGGFVHTVATERGTQTLGNSPGTGPFKNEVRKALRRQIILQTASLDLDNGIRFASLDELDSYTQFPAFEQAPL